MRADARAPRAADYIASRGGGSHQPRARHSPRCGRSVPSVVSWPWPGYTQVVSGKGEPLSVNYRLHLVQDDWKVYDVVVDNISLVSNFHSQFNRILATASFDELLKKLREKSDKPV